MSLSDDIDKAMDDMLNAPLRPRQTFVSRNTAKVIAFVHFHDRMPTYDESDAMMAEGRGMTLEEFRRSWGWRRRARTALRRSRAAETWRRSRVRRGVSMLRLRVRAFRDPYWGDPW